MLTQGASKNTTAMILYFCQNCQYHMCPPVRSAAAVFRTVFSTRPSSSPRPSCTTNPTSSPRPAGRRCREGRPKLLDLLHLHIPHHSGGLIKLQDCDTNSGKSIGVVWKNLPRDLTWPNFPDKPSGRFSSFWIEIVKIMQHRVTLRLTLNIFMFY